MFRTLLLGFTVLAVAATAAVAAPQKGKPPPTGPGCKPQVSVILRGTVAVAPTGGATLPFGLKVTVKHSNKLGQAYITASQPVTVNVTSDTKIRRDNEQGLDALRAMLVGDRVLVQARVCKADLVGGKTPALTAKRVGAHPAKS
jgi:hypothetical protein